MGPGLTVVLILLAEIVAHGLGQAQLGVTLFLLALAPIAYAGLRSGFLNALVCSLILSVYALHYVAPHDVPAKLDAGGLISALIVLVLGLGMGWPMSRVRAREMKLNTELAARATDLEARNRELLQANASLEAFGYVVSHDLKEPVRALENYLDAAREEWPSADSRAFLEEAYQANRRLARLLEGLLSYSRASSTQATAEPVALTELLRGEGCRVQFGALAHERGATVVIDDDLPVVQGDRVLLSQVFGNLVLNAVRHHPRGPARIRVRALSGDERVAHLAVEDDGEGFPPDVLARFSRLESGRPATIKSGFGLAIAHRAAQRLGGRLWLENGPQGGAVAHVELPAASLSEVRKGMFALPQAHDAPPRMLNPR